jgi:hypothetical protein
MKGSYIAHFTNVSMRFTTSGGLFRAAYYGALAAEIYITYTMGVVEHDWEKFKKNTRRSLTSPSSAQLPESLYHTIPFCFEQPNHKVKFIFKQIMHSSSIRILYCVVNATILLDILSNTKKDLPRRELFFRAIQF